MKIPPAEWQDPKAFLPDEAEGDQEKGEPAQPVGHAPEDPAAPERQDEPGDDRH